MSVVETKVTATAGGGDARRAAKVAEVFLRATRCARCSAPLGAAAARAVLGDGQNLECVCGPCGEAEALKTRRAAMPAPVDRLARQKAALTQRENALPHRQSRRSV